MTTTVTVRCALVKVTQNTFRFAETDANGKVLDMRDGKVGTVYVKKSVFGGAQPQAIRVTVEAAE